MSLLGMSVGMSSLMPDARPRRIVAGMVAVFGLVGAGVVMTPQRSAAIAETVMGAADPMTVLAVRSPGSRPAGALYQTKPRRRTGETWTSTARPRIPVAVTPEAPSFSVPVAGVPIDGVLEPEGFAFEGASPFIPGGSVGTGGVNLVGGGIGGGAIGGGGGGLGNPGGGITTPTPTPTPTSPVPEPATWLTMVLGFGIMGSALRRRRALVPAG